MKLLSWNVNGIRAVMKKGFMDFFTAQKPDILAVQETKARPEQVELDLPGYYQYWNSAYKKGYSGTAIFTKKKPLSVVNGMGRKEHDNEGRLITAEFEKFFLVNVYTPNAQRGLQRLDYRMDWDHAFRKHLTKLERSKPVIICGDLNVAHTEIDLANPSSNRKNPGFSDAERESFNKLLDQGVTDTFREFVADPGHYTWWSYMFNARAKNIGWRIDYFLASNALNKKYAKSFILPDVMGSDHCPVGLLLR